MSIELRRFTGLGEVYSRAGLDPWKFAIKRVSDGSHPVGISFQEKGTEETADGFRTPVQLVAHDSDAPGALLQALRCLQKASDIVAVALHTPVRRPRVRFLARQTADESIEFAQVSEVLWPKVAAQASGSPPDLSGLPDPAMRALSHYARGIGRTDISERLLWLWVAAEAMNDCFSTSVRLYHRCPNCGVELKQCPACNRDVPPARPQLDGVLEMFRRFGADHDGSGFAEVKALRDTLLHSSLEPAESDVRALNLVSRLERVLRRAIFSFVPGEDIAPYGGPPVVGLDVMVHGYLNGADLGGVMFPVLSVEYRSATPAMSPASPSAELQVTASLNTELTQLGFSLRTIHIGLLLCP